MTLAVGAAMLVAWCQSPVHPELAWKRVHKPAKPLCIIGIAALLLFEHV